MDGLDPDPVPCLEPSKTREPGEDEEETGLKEHSYPYDLDRQGRLTLDSPEGRQPITKVLFALDHERFGIRSASPSGRWALLAGPEFHHAP